MTETKQKVKSNTAQIRVKQLIIDSGFELKPNEKEFNFIERFLIDQQANHKELSENLDTAANSDIECSELLKASIDSLEEATAEIELLKEQIIALENSEDNQEVTEKVTGNNSEEINENQEVTESVNEQAIELLKESAAGFSDGLHFRSYCYRVMQFIESIKGA